MKIYHRKVKFCKCDYCDKTTRNNQPSMEKHERSCAMRADRRCGWCKREWPAERMNPPLTWPSNEYSGWDTRDAPEQIARMEAHYLTEQYEASNPCPGCIMAEFRQAGVPADMCGWNYTVAVSNWQDAQRAERDADAQLAQGCYL